MTERFDVAVIGAGAAGMMCAAVAGQRGRSVVLIDHAQKLAEKIRISGGGRCNFTNRNVGVDNFVSENPDFARVALTRYTPADFIELVRRHRIGFHEKHRGQLFCDDASERIIAMLVAECDAGGVAWRRPARIGNVGVETVAGARSFRIDSDAGAFLARHVVIATGGLSIPRIGATDFAYRIAERFAVRVVEPRPALVPLTFAPQRWAPFAALSGIALEVGIRCRDGHMRDRASGRFTEDLLITHRGLSGPAVLQISNYWKPGTPIEIDMAPSIDLAAALADSKATSRQNISHVLATLLPKRLAVQWLETVACAGDRRIAEIPNGALRGLADGIKHWTLVPDGTEGYRKAEVTGGGVATGELSQRTMEAVRVPGLYFIGEAVDVTGWLGGYNFQWAWASGFAAGQAV